MKQLRLLFGDWFLGLALYFAGDLWSTKTLIHYRDLCASIVDDMNAH